MEERGVYGQVNCDKPDNVVRVMYKNFSSRSLFAVGDMRHKKIRQINKLMSDYGIDILAGCKTRTDFRFVMEEDNKFCNLFRRGQPTKGVVAQNLNNKKIRRDQWEGTCSMVAVGRISLFVKGSGTDTTGLGRWCWLYIGGGSSTTRIITAYQPCKPGRNKKGGTVWEQHTRYFKARGEVRNPRQMFLVDLLSILWRWKAAGDKILLVGDFNQNVYAGTLAEALSRDKFRMSEVCQCTTGLSLPPTHNRGMVAIDAFFGTSGTISAAAALHPSRVRVSDHRVSVVDFTSKLVMGDDLPRVIPATGHLLNCSSDRIKNNYIQMLNQLANRHLIFKKLLIIDQDSNRISPVQVQLRMNKVDLGLKQFMKASEQECHKHVKDNIEFSLYSGEWLHRRWLLARIQQYLQGKTRDPRNLFRECRKQGVKDPQHIMQDELKTEFWVCRHNLDLLSKNGPHYQREFLKSLVSTGKRKGDKARAAKILGILHKEASRKGWRRVNLSTHAARGGLIVAVKTPAASRGVDEFKTKEGVFHAVSATPVERFQSALIAPCHKGIFLKTSGTSWTAQWRNKYLRAHTNTHLTSIQQLGYC
jgi:hypothetical protein